jgi:hypothetical protein
MQGYLYAIGPADVNHPAGTLYRAFGRDTSNPHTPPPGAPPVAAPVSEYASLRYGNARCLGISANEGNALRPYVVPITQALAPGFTPNGGSFTNWVPPFWVPTNVNTTPPPIVSQTGSLIGVAPTPEGQAKLPGKVTGNGEGNHPLP